MLRSVLRRICTVLALAALLLPTAVFAHERREVGPYTFVVGFITEPAYENEQNGLWLKINDRESGQPIEQVQDTLQARVIQGAAERDLTLRPAFGEKGIYTAVFYPTVPGDYTFQFSGTISDTAVSERFTSSPDGFDSVVATTDIQFPEPLPDTEALTAALADAQQTARLSLIVGGVGVAIGLLGVIFGALALRRWQRSADRSGAANLSR